MVSTRSNRLRNSGGGGSIIGGLILVSLIHFEIYLFFRSVNTNCEYHPPPPPIIELSPPLVKTSQQRLRL